MKLYEAIQTVEKGKKLSFTTKRGRFAANFPKGGDNYTFHPFLYFFSEILFFVAAFCHPHEVNMQRFSR